MGTRIDSETRVYHRGEWETASGGENAPSPLSVLNV